MNPYQDLIETYLFQSFPATPAKTNTQFEAVSAAVLGTKQRRFGPMLPPEEQVKVRDVLRRDGPATFFMPWGASKQELSMGLDVMELSAVKQLACLKDELAHYGKQSRFVFRLEDLTDVYLLGEPGRMTAVDRYVSNFTKLVKLTLGNDADVRLESDCVQLHMFTDIANGYQPLFYDYLRWGGDDRLAKLKMVGWKGTIPQAQRDYYVSAYTQLGVPEHDRLAMLARYFAATLTRVKTGSTRTPTDADGRGVPFVLIAFTHPVPENPVGTPRVYYRTIPERYTNHHRSPWLAKGYLRINDDGSVTPRCLTDDTKLTPNTTVWNGVELSLDYVTE